MGNPTPMLAQSLTRAHTLQDGPFSVVLLVLGKEVNFSKCFFRESANPTHESSTPTTGSALRAPHLTTSAGEYPHTDLSESQTLRPRRDHCSLQSDLSVDILQRLVSQQPLIALP